LQVKDIAELDASGMLNMCTRCVREGKFAFNAHITGVLAILLVGITLFVNLQGCGKPQEADGQMWIPTFFVV